MNRLKRLSKFGRRLALSALVFAGLAGVIASIAWIGCATAPANDQARRSLPPPTEPPYGSWTEGVRSPPPPPRVDRFKENVLFLNEANVPVSEVYASFGPTDWESTELRVLAYRARNNQVLMVSYGTNHFVTHHTVKKIKLTDSLREIATKWNGTDYQ